ncbi:MAG: fused MFS/spermidine synthase [Myxococcota bacterium]
MDLRFLLVLVCFFVSGFAGLLYETAWTREFSFVFGTSNLAVATVLAAYMGGLSLGAAIAARLLHRIRRPVLVYGLLELGIAASALAVPYLIRAVTMLYRPLFATAGVLPEEGGAASALFYGAASFVILAVPTTLMGATLPMLARHAVHDEAQIGRRIGTLYAVNTAGAVAGTLATAFLLLPELGLRLTVWTGALLNGVVFVAAAGLARGVGAAARPATPSTALPLAWRGRVVLAVAFCSSVASFTYENLWFRLFEQVVGASIYAFSTMLGGFLIGIALGGAAAAPLARTRRGSAVGLALSQIGAAVFSALAFVWVDSLPMLAASVNQPGILGVATRASVAAALLLPSTLCIGASFPFAVRALTESVEAAAATSARVYAWNTLGAIVGSVAAGFWVIPGLGFERTLLATALLNLFAAGLASTSTGRLARPVLAAATACAVALLVVRPSEPWRLISASILAFDVAGGGGKPVDPDKVVYTGVGRSSTVLMFEEAGAYRLRNNGLPEASIARDGAVPANSLTARRMSLLPAFAPAAPRDMLVIGFGGGVVVEQVPASFERIDVIELERKVIEANRSVSKLRARDPFADPRLRVLINDARGALMLTDLRYGAIVSQPSHPWTAGASHLYTRDFFEQVRGRLAPGGVFVQWMGMQFVDEPLLRSMLATLLDVFPYVRVYGADPGSLLFVSSPEPFDLESRAEEAMAGDPSFGLAGLRTREHLAAELLLDERGAKALAEGAPVVTDDRNRFATDSPRALAHPISDVRKLLAPHDPLVGNMDGLDPVYLIRYLARGRQIPRAKRLAKSLDDPLTRTLAEIEIAHARGEPRKKKQLIESALALDPNALVALYYADPREVPSSLDAEGVRLMRKTFRLHEARDWERLATHDDALAGLDPAHPGFPEALWMRIDWRIGARDAARAREAIELIDTQPFSGPEQLARRAIAGVVSAAPGVAQQSLGLMAGMMLGKKVQMSPLAAAWSLEALDATPESSDTPAFHRLRPKLEKVARAEIEKVARAETPQD